ANSFSNTSLDAGKTILVRDAGPGVPPTDLLTTIVSITDSSTAILAAAASSLVPAGNGAGYFGTDDSGAIQTVIGQATTGGQLLFPAGTYVIASPLVFGDGTNPFDAVVVQGSGNS